MTDRTDRPSFTYAQISAFRLHLHGLGVRVPRDQLQTVIGEVCGVRAQVTVMSRIALWAR